MKSKIIFGLIFLFIIVSCAQQEQIAPQTSKNQMKNVDMLKTNVSGVETEMVDYGAATGFLAKPKSIRSKASGELENVSFSSKEGVYPAVVMMHEWWGLNDNIKEMARQLAAEGYVVLAVDLFNGKVAKDSNEAMQLITPLNKNPEEAIKNMKSAVEFLRSKNYVDKNKIASMGWCFGGGMSLRLALNEKMAATVIYYGNLETDKAKLSTIKWPVLGIFGDKDTSIPVESARLFHKTLNDLKIENEIHIYKGVGHAFANPSGMNYAPEETKDAWNKTVDFLNRNLKKK